MHKPTGFRRVLLIVLLAALVAAIVPGFGATGADASELEDLQKELEALQKQMEDLLRKLTTSSVQEKQVLADLASIEAQLDRTQTQLSKLENDLAYLEGQIRIAAADLEVAEVELTKRQDYLSRRVRAIYESGTVGYVEVLLGSTSFSDFLNRWELLRQLVAQDNQLFEQVKQERAEVAARKVDLETKRRQALSLRDQATVRQASYAYQQGVKEQYLAKVREDRDLYEKAINELEAVSQQLEDEIRQLAPWGIRPTGKLLWPTTSTRITSYYGNRFHPILKTYRLHTGIDIGAPSGTRIFAAEWGIVRTAGGLSAYGLTVMVDHGGGLWTLYAHMSKLAVKVGETVARGQIIGYVGSTGWSTGPHLHFEVRDNGAPVDAMKWLK